MLSPLTGTLGPLTVRGARGPSLLLHDDFTALDGTALAAHAIAPENPLDLSWSTNGGDWAIQNNRLTETISVGAGTRYVASVDVGRANVLLRAEVVISSALYHAQGIAARFSDDGNFWWFVVERDAGGTPYVVLVERSGGAQSLHGIVTNPDWIDTAVTLQMRCAGSLIECAVDGEVLITHEAATSNQGATRHGLGVFRSSQYVTQPFDYFRVEAA